ncbi:MAG: zinc ribbon domain-containing protein [Chloroflexota bacterium]|nr:zinc ribbon domain-containing protein [Chloroflexota bacterium]MDE2685394.1 zinc ribbon domain-containing protein [Chloroflexota bacterium]
MEQIVGYCPGCGSGYDEGSKFCVRCGAAIPQNVSPEAATTTEASSTAEPASARDASASGAGSTVRSVYQRYATIDASGGFLTTVGPVLIWSGAVGVLIWAIIGLISLRFDIGAIIDLESLLLSMLILVGIVLSTAVNYYLIHRFRERTGQLWDALSYLPFIWGALISVGLLIMILQVWTDFAWGPDDLRRAMFSLIGVGLCGTYGGYLALVDVGMTRIYRIVQGTLYPLLVLIAVEILDAIWLGSRGRSGQEMMDSFAAALGTAVSVVIVYSIVAALMSQARARKTRTFVLVAYVVLGLVGFTSAVGILWDDLPAGAMRFIHGGIVLVSIATIGLLLVRYLRRIPIPTATDENTDANPQPDRNLES